MAAEGRCLRHVVEQEAVGRTPRDLMDRNENVHCRKPESLPFGSGEGGEPPCVMDRGFAEGDPPLHEVHDEERGTEEGGIRLNPSDIGYSDPCRRESLQHPSLSCHVGVSEDGRSIRLAAKDQTLDLASERGIEKNSVVRLTGGRTRQLRDRHFVRTRLFRQPRRERSGEALRLQPSWQSSKCLDE